MFRVDKEKIADNINHCGNDIPESNIEDSGKPCCEGDDCQLPEWAAEDQ